MTSDGRKGDVKTVEKYISALMESFIAYQAKRYECGYWSYTGKCDLFGTYSTRI